MGRKVILLALFLGMFCGTPMAKASLVGFYTFDQNVSDSSGNGNNGTVHGSVSYTNNGPFGGSALTLDGSTKDNYVSVPINTAIEQTPSETFGAWVLVPTGASTSSIRGLISSDDGNFDPTLDVDTRNGGFKYSAFIGGTVVGNGTANTGVWTFVAVSYSGGANGAYIFQVGANQLQGATQFDNGGVQNTTYIGINPNFDSEFQGEIADAFFFNNALTASQLNAIEQGGPNAIFTTPEPSAFVVWAGGILLLAVGTRMRWIRLLQRL